MYFKRLELFGFKSFADKTVLHFEPGVTAVVGPNGCGKSNISDSMRWVLGEQSPKSLRGGKMEDVIFNGTDIKPAVNLAEVSLTLSNEQKLLPIDYDEVTITRRLFRSGESEYLINNNLVRLKDVSELLMGTGLGTESYSMFEQGKMDQIISSKPDERRFLFEEASGITRYKTKKREALRKLEQTEANLLRVNDIITEVTRQLNSIQRQVNKARQYKEEFEKLKTLEVRFSANEFRQLNQDNSAILSQQQKCRDEEAALGRQLEELVRMLEELHSQSAELESAYSQAQKEYLAIEGAIDKNNHKTAFNKERVSEYSQRTAELLRNTGNIDKKVNELKIQVEEFRNSLAELTTMEERHKQTLDSKETALKANDIRIKEAQNNIEQGKLRIVDMAASQTRIKNDLAKTSANIANILARMRRLKLERENLGVEMRGVNEKFNQTTLDVEISRGKVNILKDEEKNLIQQAEQEKAAINTLALTLEELRQKFSAVRSRLEFLEDMNRRYEGFASGVKALLKNKDAGAEQVPGIIGALANLIEVEKGYELAVETALGQLLGAIVVETRDSACQAVKYLQQHQLGNAVFISLEDMAEGSSADDLPLKKITDVIKTDGRFRPMINYLLKNVFLVADFDQAAGFYAASRNSGQCFITPAGEMIRSGCFSGGVILQDEEKNLLTRQARIRQLKEDDQNLSREISGREQEKNSHMLGLADLNTRIEEHVCLRHELELALSNKEIELANISEQQRKVNDEFSLLDLEFDEAQVQEGELKAKEEDLKHNLQSLDEESINLQNVLALSHAAVEQAARQRENLLVEITQLRTEIASVDERRATAAETFKMLDLALREQTSQAAGVKSEIEDLDRRITQLDTENKNLESEKIAFFTQKEEISAKLNTIENKRKAGRQEIDECQKSVYGLNKKQDESKNTIRDLEIKANEYSYKIQTLVNRMVETYKIEANGLEQQELSAGETDWPLAKAEIEQIKAKLERLGTVNLAAIEEEQELSQRANFLNSQRQDLLQAQDSLHKAIAKINKTTRVMFMETFEKTRINFRDFFRLLFGGGDAQLMLLDEQDVLESGIEIVVRPPGKKLQTISLLSGGEKALTAIALLFAIFKVRPSPFCVLDEIDAPLDEANIGRFTKVLQDFLRLSQFIIITHNKKTITMADVMYGVTMQEFGVSKIVSVKFKETKKEAPRPEGMTPPARMPQAMPVA